MFKKKYNNINNQLYYKYSKIIFKEIKHKNIIGVDLDNDFQIIVDKFVHAQFWDIDYCYQVTLRNNKEDKIIVQFQTENKRKYYLGVILRYALRRYQEETGIDDYWTQS